MKPEREIKELVNIGFLGVWKSNLFYPGMLRQLIRVLYDKEQVYSHRRSDVWTELQAYPQIVLYDVLLAGIFKVGQSTSYG